ncbi:MULTISPECIES: HD domain-containing protein [Clostridium]|uniref:HD domain-containing protein n=1 Tax=Clostridium senegalense TaxID=1465809 RepID=A0A6M0H9R1_9CLOT|nr:MULTISPECIES: HD domain-containing protein [Clostridium]NEU06631.1 HD domain-containing protein [Clostridium senegalense]
MRKKLIIILCGISIISLISGSFIYVKNKNHSKSIGTNTINENGSNITYNEEEILKKIREINKSLGEKDAEELVEHSKKVKEISLIIFDELGMDEKYKDIVGISALLHDIQKHTGDEHNKVGAKYLEENMDKILNCDDKAKELIILAVRWHKGSKYTEEIKDENYLKVVETVRAADKIAKLFKDNNSTLDENKLEAKSKIDELQNSDIKEASYKLIDEYYNKLNNQS